MPGSPAGSPAVLAPGGRALLEIGAGQGAAVAALLRAAGFARVAVHPDLDGRDRVVEVAAGLSRGRLSACHFRGGCLYRSVDPATSVRIRRCDAGADPIRALTHRDDGWRAAERRIASPAKPTMAETLTA